MNVFPTDPQTSGRLRRWRARANSSAGFTIVEVLVASIVLTIGIVALFSNFETSQKLGTSAEAHQTAVAVAEGELERIRGLAWSEIGIGTGKVPASSGEKTNPGFYLASEATKCTNKGKGAKELGNCYEWNPEEVATKEPIVTEAGSESKEDPLTVTMASVVKGGTTRLTFKVYRFITWVNDGSCTSSSCGGEMDAKRVVVSVTGSHLDKPVTVMSIVNDMELGTKNPVKELKCTEGASESACVSQS